MSRRLTIPSPFGGVSRQPPSIRHKNQVENAINARFDVAYGYSKRPASRYVAKITGLTAGGNYRLHVIERDDSEKYLVLYGAGDIRVFDLEGREQNVEISAEAQAYLDDDGTIAQAGADADDLILATSADYTLVANRNTVCRAGSSERFTLTGTHTDYDAMIATTPANNTYHRTQNAGGGHAAGYWKYAGLGAATFPKWYSRTLSGIWTQVAYYQNAAANPGGFKMTFTQPGGADLVADLSTLNFTTAANMAAIAAEIQSELQSTTGNPNILCAYETITTTTGRFVITGPFDGVGAKIIGPVAPTAAVFNWTAGTIGRPFQLNDPLASRVDGTGDPAGTLDVIDRWTRVAAPGQLNAVPDPDTLPMTLKRLAVAYIDEDGDRHESEWSLDVSQWSSRLSGDDASNPAPHLIATEANTARTVSDMTFFKNRLVFAVDDHVVMSGADDLFNLYIEDVTNLGDGDRIDVAIGSADVNVIDYFVTFRGGLVIFSRAGRQFELKSDEPITPSNTPITPTTRYQTTPNLRPRAMHHFIYFAGNRNLSSQVYEYFFSDSDQTNIAAEVSKHVADYVPADLKTLEASPNNATAFALERDGHRIFVYTPFWDGARKVQSAWGTYSFDSTDRIVDLAVVRDECYLLVELDGGQFVLDKLSIPDESAGVRSGQWWGTAIAGLHYGSYTAITNGSLRITIDGATNNVSGINLSAQTTLAGIASQIQTAIRTAFSSSTITVEVRGERFVITSGTTGSSSSVSAPTAHGGAVGTNLATAALMGVTGTTYEPEEPFAVLLDRRQEVTGTYNSGTNLTTFEHATIDPTITEIVLGRAFGAAAGTRMVGTAAASGTGSRLTLAGRWDYGVVYMGRPYTMSVQHSRPYVRDQNDEPILNGRLQLVKLNVNHRDTGYYSVRVEQDGKADREKEMRPYETGVALVGQFEIDDAGETDVFVRGGSDSTRVFVENDTPLPSIITGLEWSGEFTRRS